MGGKDFLGERQPLTSRTPDLVDEHYHCSALEMMDNAARYDTYPQTGHKAFVGEWATREGFVQRYLRAVLRHGAGALHAVRPVAVTEEEEVESCY